MGELRSMNVVLGAIYDPDTINNALRAGPKELQDWLGWLMFGDTDAGYGVVGFNASAASLDVTVTRGGGLVYNASAPSPASKWAWVYSGASVVKAIGAHHGTNARYDLISLTWAQATDTPVNVGYEGGIPASTNTQRGCQATLTVTAGVTDGSLAKPSTPSGAVALWYVYVPASSGALVLVDARRHLPGPHYRDGLAPMVTYTDIATDAVQATVSARKVNQGDTAWASLQGWDVTEDWPYLLRGKAAAGDIDGATKLYPMLALGRTWWRAMPFIGKEYDLGSTPLTSIFGANYLTIARTDTGAISYQMSVPIPADTRALEVVAAKLRYQVMTAFDATFSERLVELIHVAADGTATVVGSATLTLSSVPGSVQTITFTSLATPTIAEGDFLYAQLRFASSATGTAVGTVRMFGLDVQFKEGRA